MAQRVEIWVVGLLGKEEKKKRQSNLQHIGWNAFSRLWGEISYFRSSFFSISLDFSFSLSP
jgi:hypothetical protein